MTRFSSGLKSLAATADASRCLAVNSMKLLLEVDGGAIAAAETATHKLDFFICELIMRENPNKILTKHLPLARVCGRRRFRLRLRHLGRKSIVKQGNTNRR